MFDERQFIIGLGVFILGVEDNRVFEHLDGLGDGGFGHRQFLRGGGGGGGHHAGHGEVGIGQMKERVAPVVEGAGLQG